jgi:hypothetical protein
MTTTSTVQLQCPSCGGDATATLVDISIEEAVVVMPTVERYQCPNLCQLTDDVILKAIGLE